MSLRDRLSAIDPADTYKRTHIMLAIKARELLLDDVGERYFESLKDLNVLLFCISKNKYNAPQAIEHEITRAGWVRTVVSYQNGFTQVLKSSRFTNGCVMEVPGNTGCSWTLRFTDNQQTNDSTIYVNVCEIIDYLRNKRFEYERTQSKKSLDRYQADDAPF